MQASPEGQSREASVNVFPLRLLKINQREKEKRSQATHKDDAKRDFSTLNTTCTHCFCAVCHTHTNEADPLSSQVTLSYWCEVHTVSSINLPANRVTFSKHWQAGLQLFSSTQFCGEDDDDDRLHPSVFVYDNLIPTFPAGERWLRFTTTLLAFNKTMTLCVPVSFCPNKRKLPTPPPLSSCEWWTKITTTRQCHTFTHWIVSLRGLAGF